MKQDTITLLQPTDIILNLELCWGQIAEVDFKIYLAALCFSLLLLVLPLLLKLYKVYGF